MGRPWAQTWVAVRFNGDGLYRGWCGHRHRIEDQAVACARRLDQSWSHVDTGPDFGATWRVATYTELRELGGYT
jgi:hypothetical protein